MNASVCEKCGAMLTDENNWPFCPHGRYTGVVVPDEWPGGQVFEHLDHQPMRLYSRSELKREMDKRGLHHKVQHRPPPGGDKSSLTQRWI